MTKETITNYHSITMKHWLVLKLKLIQTKKSVFSAIGISATSEILTWLSSWRIFNCRHKQLLRKSWLLDVWQGSKCDKVFKNGQSEICGRQPLKNLKWYGLLKRKRLSLTHFTWSILDFFIPNIPLNFPSWGLGTDPTCL